MLLTARGSRPSLPESNEPSSLTEMIGEQRKGVVPQAKYRLGIGAIVLNRRLLGLVYRKETMLFSALMGLALLFLAMFCDELLQAFRPPLRKPYLAQ
jgi:hypothetical protein